MLKPKTGFLQKYRNHHKQPLPYRFIILAIALGVLFYLLAK